MKYRPLGTTSIDVSEIGFGAWGIGGITPGPTSYGKTNDEESLQALQTAFDNGITFFDTANVYGDGKSEELIKQAFRSNRHDIVISTKAGCNDYQQPLDFSAKNIRQTLEGSLKRLNTDYIDLLMLHDPLPDDPLLEESFSELNTLKGHGKIRALGVSVRTPDDINEFLKMDKIDAFQVNLNLMDQRIIDCGALDNAAKSGSAIVSRTPLCFGFLSERLNDTFNFGSSDHRSRWPRSQIQLWQDGCRLFADKLTKNNKQSISQIALRYCLSHKGVSSVIPGILTSQEAMENADASNLGPLTDHDLTEARKIYAEHSFFSERPADKLTMADK